MQVLKIDDNALIPAPPVAPVPVVSGEPGPEEIWREPGDPNTSGLLYPDAASFLSQQTRRVSHCHEHRSDCDRDRSSVCPLGRLVRFRCTSALVLRVPGGYDLGVSWTRRDIKDRVLSL